jgi:hypothetical protein
MTVKPTYDDAALFSQIAASAGTPLRDARAIAA